MDRIQNRTVDVEALCLVGHDMLLEEKLMYVVETLEKGKAQDTCIIDVRNNNLYMDVVISVTATSSRHGQGLADGILELCKNKGYEFLQMEGYHNGQWILVDLNDIVVNIFQAVTRELYAIERLWKGAPTVYTNPVL